jgi:hypothetical protein
VCPWRAPHRMAPPRGLSTGLNSSARTRIGAMPSKPIRVPPLTRRGRR